MRGPRVLAPALAATTLLALAPASFVARGQEQVKSVSGGGVSVKGWTGTIDGSRENTGLSLKDAKLVKEGKALHVTTGPAVTYWNPNNKASGNYTVRATFTEPKFMGLNSHPHPYGIMIGGNDLGTDKQSFLYCAAYGDGRFIVRGFGPSPFQLNGRGEANAAVHKVSQGEPVSQEVAVSVTGDKVECSVNGTVVGSYNKSGVVGPGKLTSTDGIYGIRFGHNTEAKVTDLKMTKNK